MSIAEFSFLRRLRTRSRVGWIGIDIGSHSIKLAQLELVNGEKQIADAAIIPIPDSASLTAESLGSGWFTRLLREELQHHRGFKGRNVACGLSMSVSEFRSMSIPPGSVNERREMIAQELAENSNSSSGGIEFDFWDSYVSSADLNNADSLVNVLSVSDALATHVAQAIQAAGLNCQVLDGGPFSLARSIELVDGELEPDRAVAVLDWGHQAAHFAIIMNHQPVFSRLLKDCGIGTLMTAVKRGLGLSTEDCHELLATSGVSNPQLERSECTELQELVDDFTGEIFHGLIPELEKTLAYLRTQRAELVPDSMWLVGGGATVRNMAARLTLESGMPVAAWQLPQRTTFNGSSAAPSVEVLAQAAALSELGWRS